MITEFLCYPPGASGRAVRIESHGDGLPDLAGARFIALLQRGHEQGVSSEGGDVAGEHRFLPCLAHRSRPSPGPYMASLLPTGRRSYEASVSLGLAARQNRAWGLTRTGR